MSNKFARRPTHTSHKYPSASLKTSDFYPYHLAFRSAPPMTTSYHLSERAETYSERLVAQPARSETYFEELSVDSARSGGRHEGSIGRFGAKRRYVTPHFASLRTL
jgi:hypothetical protein